MNDLSQRDQKYFRKMKPSELELCSCECIKRVCIGTYFLPEDISLVSGHSFPDIVAKGSFGVEIKSTETWWLGANTPVAMNIMRKG